MSDAEKHGEVVRRLRDAILQKSLSFRDDTHLLEDWKAELPFLRRWLLGDRDGDMVLMPGTFRVSRDSSSILIVLQSAQFQIDASYRGKSIFGLFETIENDIAAECTPWEPNWQQKQKEKKRFSVE